MPGRPFRILVLVSLAIVFAEGARAGSPVVAAGGRVFAATMPGALFGGTISDMAVTKTDNRPTYDPGAPLTYTIVVSNVGPDAVTGATVIDSLPAELTNVSWWCSASAGSSCVTSNGTGNINAQANVLAGGTVTITATSTVAISATGPISNTATVLVPPGWTDPEPANNSATDTDTLAPLSPVALSVDPAGNGVFQPNETVIVAPSWRNNQASPATITGTFSNFNGPAGPVYVIVDATANYGTIASGGTITCSTSSDCYVVGNIVVTRPATHWDATVLETVGGGTATKTWTLHIGDSFTDVLPNQGIYRFVETILHKGITAGCAAAQYCPDSSVTRAQMAIFLLTARFGPSYVPPPATGTIFDDVQTNTFGAAWIEDLYNRGISAGCSVTPPLYCPGSAVTRAQMSVFLLVTKLGTGYLPPPATGIFDDVPPGDGFARWIEDLYNRGITAGCSTNPPLYCPSSSNTRGQMAVFLTTTFDLKLYAP